MLGTRSVCGGQRCLCLVAGTPRCAFVCVRVSVCMWGAEMFVFGGGDSQVIRERQRLELLERDNDERAIDWREIDWRETMTREGKTHHVQSRERQ